MKTFQELGLEDNLLKAVNDLGFENPTEIQEKTIPVLTSSLKDMVALAQTGTGKNGRIRISNFTTTRCFQQDDTGTGPGSHTRTLLTNYQRAQTLRKILQWAKCCCYLWWS